MSQPEFEVIKDLLLRYERGPDATVEDLALAAYQRGVADGIKQAKGGEASAEWSTRPKQHDP